MMSNEPIQLNMAYEHHNPKLYQPIMQELLTKLGNDWNDVSYGNDLVASICKDDIVICLPNSTKTNWDNEEFADFTITKADKFIECKSIDEVLNKIKDFQ